VGRASGGLRLQLVSAFASAISIQTPQASAILGLQIQRGAAGYRATPGYMIESSASVVITRSGLTPRARDGTASGRGRDERWHEASSEPIEDQFDER
jgi:hypothetical protein